jgi:hypothetical protein
LLIPSTLRACLWVGCFRMLSINASGHQATSLSCLESLCYEQISFWVGVVAKNGGRSGRVVAGTPWTRLTASDFVRLLGERFPMLAVTERQVRYALNRLVDLGLVLREKFWQSECFRSHSWWALSACPDVAPCPEDAPAVGTPIVTPDAPPVVTGTDTGVTPNLCTLTSSSDLPLIQAGRRDRAELTEGSSCSGGMGAISPPPQPVVIGPHCPLGQSQGGIWARINALASSFCPDAVDPVSPSGVIVRGRLLRVDDGACAPLR